MTRGKTHAEKVKFIMENKDKVSRKELAKMFNIGTPAICKIIKKKERQTVEQGKFNIDKDGSVFYF